MSLRGRGDRIRANPGTDRWWQEQRGRCDQRGAGVTGVVILDGVGFQLPSHTPLPSVTVQPGGALAAWLQTDDGTFSGYPPGAGGIY